MEFIINHRLSNKWRVCPGLYSKNQIGGSRAGMGSVYNERRKGWKMKGVEWGGVGWNEEEWGGGCSGVEWGGVECGGVVWS